MKQANMNLNFKEDTTSVFAEITDLVGTKIKYYDFALTIPYRII